MICKAHTINNKILTIDNKAVSSLIDPLNPYNLPPFSIRFRLVPGTVYNPDYLVESVTEIDKANGIWQIYVPHTNWSLLMHEIPDLLEIIAVNSTGVIAMDMFLAGNERLMKVPLFDTSSVMSMVQMFDGCSNYLTEVPDYDTSNVKYFNAMFRNCYCLQKAPNFDTSNAISMPGMFQNCTSLEDVHLYNTSKAQNVTQMYAGCVNVWRYAHSFYLQMANQTTPPAQHVETFKDCGINTTRGRNELSLIPADWK
ncbi:MAG: BspA family leucine-rich repeat surface protein [Treponema sp.]|nr:BspA family leucine-rich repeat surface protein [Treponema sp.]